MCPRRVSCWVSNLGPDLYHAAGSHDQRDGLGFWYKSIAKFLIPDLGDIVDSTIGLSYRPDSLCSLAGRCDNPMPESTISPSQGLRIWLQSRFAMRDLSIDGCLSTNSLMLTVARSWAASARAAGTARIFKPPPPQPLSYCWARHRLGPVL